MDAAPASSSLPGSSFVILSVSIVGILAISILLLAYYIFLTRCRLLFFWRPDLQLHHLHDHDHRTSVSVTVQEHPPRRSGLEEAAIRRIPTFRFRYRYRDDDVSSKRHHQPLLPARECAVCLADFRDGERLRLLPPCLHAFHIDCIDAWLQAAANCPLCRAAVVVVDPSAALPLPHLHAPDDDVVIDVAAEAAGQPAAASDSSGPSSSGSNSFLPMRRSLSMDSCADKGFYLALQRALHHQNSGSPAAGDEQGGKGSSRRLRRSFFSFSQSRGSRSAVLPL